MSVDIPCKLSLVPVSILCFTTWVIKCKCTMITVSVRRHYTISVHCSMQDVIYTLLMCIFITPNTLSHWSMEMHRRRDERLGYSKNNPRIFFTTHVAFKSKTMLRLLNVFKIAKMKHIFIYFVTN